MKLLKISLLSLATIFSLIVAPATFAEEEKQKETPAPISLSDVDFSNFEIISQEGNNFELTFTISNGQRAQSGVRYGVALNPKDVYPVGVANEYVYSELLTLDSNYETTKNIKYTAPYNLEGDYEIRIVAKNKQGLILGLSKYEEIKLEKSNSFIEVVKDSCKVVIAGNGEEFLLKEKEGAFVIPKGDKISINCLVKNNNQREVLVNPKYEIYSNNAYGDLIEEDLGLPEISFLSEEEKMVTWDLPNLIGDNTNATKIFLKGENLLSNSLVISYSYPREKQVVSLNNISLDKTYYTKGDQAKISFIWIDPTLNDEVFTLKTSIMDKKGEVCLPEKIEFPVSTGEISLNGEIIKNCSNPKVLAKIENEKGEVVAQSDLVFQTINKPQLPVLDIVILVLIIILVVAGIVIFFVKPKNKKEELKNNQNINNETNN